MLLADVTGSRELLWNLTLRELRGKYKRSALGWAWSLLNPLSTMAIYTLVFGVILPGSDAIPAMPNGKKVFALYLLCGLLPWNFLAQTTSVAMGSLVANGGLVKKVWFPREVLVFATSASMLFSFMIEASLLIVQYSNLPAAGADSHTYTLFWRAIDPTTGKSIASGASPRVLSARVQAWFVHPILAARGRGDDSHFHRFDGPRRVASHVAHSRAVVAMV